MPDRKKIYFASDFHLGADALLSSKDRERLIVRWLDRIADSASELYLLGDQFDFWFEYRSVVPKGGVRLLGTLADLRDGGVHIEAFTGNHDLWMAGYFEDELGIPVHHRPIRKTWYGKSFFLGHGDGLGPGDIGFKRMKKIFVHPLSKWAFRWLHPDIGTALALYFSKKSRLAQSPAEKSWLGEENEWLLQYTLRKAVQGTRADYYMFGHRHLPIDWQLSGHSARYINTGDWLWHQSYAVFDGSDVEVCFFEAEHRVVSNR